MDYYKRYMGDYARDTSRLSMLEHGAYNLLLDDYYSARQPLPESLTDLYRICRATSKQEQAAVASVAKRFFPIAADGLRHNNRADDEIAKWEEMAAENRERGKLGGRPKKNPTGNPDENQSGYLNETRTKTSRVIKTKPAGEPGVKAAENPLQLHSQKPIPEPQPETREERAREPDSGEKQKGLEAAAYVDSHPYEQAIQAVYPQGENAPNWGAALFNARTLVTKGLATWPELAEAAERYARHFAAGTQSANIAAHNFFDPHSPKRHWAQRWEPPRTKAQLRQDANIDAAQRWLAESGET